MTLTRSLVRRLPRPARRRLVEARHLLRSMVRVERALPDLLIIGAQRCGTSSLYKYLGRHPQVVASTRKETEYFSGRYALGEHWYRAHFPSTRSITRGDVERITFEATPDYMLDPRAAERAASVVPDARIIALLRDPVARTYSHYRHMVRLGYESLSFEEALDAEHDRCREDWRRIAVDPSYRPKSLLRYSYVERGHYALQLDRWFEIYDEPSILLIRSEDFFASTRQVFARIQSFLGIDIWTPADMPNHSETGPDNLHIDPSVRDRLREHFASHSAELTRLGFKPDWVTT